MDALNLALMAGMFLVMYMFFIRPQQKKAKEQQAFMDNIQKGDEVVTASGIIGKISKVDGQTVSLQVDTKTFIRVTKNAISKEMTDALYASNSANATA